MRRIVRYWHTIRHLQPVQLYGRIWFGLTRPSPDLSPAPPLRARTPGTWVAPAPRRASLTGALTFRLLNEERSLATHGWDDPALPQLWRYNLHYFDDLNAEGADDRHSWHLDLLRRWVAENPPAAGTGWGSYPASLRIVNWIKWAWSGHALPGECVQSLAVQARYLARRFEWHFPGNHLFSNAKALVFAGCFFDGPEAARWLALGLRVIAREVPLQILDDGGQFERSPMYHALAVEDMLDILNALGNPLVEAAHIREGAVEEWRGRTKSMLSWLATMRHPDGEISFFNDSAFGIAPTPAELDRYAVRLGLSPVAHLRGGAIGLRDSGYVRAATGPAVAFLDVASVGPDFLPAHAHADTLSFELSLFGHRVFVNSGTSQYGSDPERQRQRGTRAHNTVVVDDQDSSEVWGAFRVARRAHAALLVMREADPVVVSGSHDGYHRLPGKVTHARTWTLRTRSLVVDDRLSGEFTAAEARYHLHPAVAVARHPEQPSGVLLRLADGNEATFTVERGELGIEASTWHPEFGRVSPSRCLVVRFAGSEARARLEWTA